MKILSLDRSVPFSGMTSQAAALGASQRAFIGLMEALAARGHQVTAATEGGDFVDVNGVSWVPLSSVNAAHDADGVIAWNEPDLLDVLPGTLKRALVYGGNPLNLEDPDAKMTLLAEPAKLILPERKRLAQAPDLLGVIPVSLNPGASQIFFDAEAERGPVAVTCERPSARMSALVRVWIEQIRPQSPEAELHIYSALLEKGLLGEPVPPAVELVLSAVKDGLEHGVKVCTPLPAPEMAAAFAAARVYLYVQPEEQGFGLSLAEAAAAGLPALGRIGTIAEDRIANGVGGMVVPDDAAMVNMAVTLLSGDSMFKVYSNGARAHARRWEDAATELEMFW